MRGRKKVVSPDLPIDSAENFDKITRPLHYVGVGTIEPLDFILDKNLSFCAGNVVKYVVRAGRKEGVPAIDDLRKAAQYLNRWIEAVEREGGEPE